MESLILSYRVWQHGLGLLPVPLYKGLDTQTRHVLLNGVSGNFCLDEGIELSPAERASIAWSANIGHHVTVAHDYIEVVRWDKPDTILKYTVPSIKNNLEYFHKYLEQTSPDTSNSIIAHALGVYRSMRSVLREDANGFEALNAFLYLLADASSSNEASGTISENLMLPMDAEGTFKSINQADQGYFYERLVGKIGSFRMLKPDFQLLLRHASGALFQEAHSQVVLSNENWLPGFGPIDAVLNTRSLGNTDGAFFTPPSIARTLAEEALREYGTLDEGEFIIFDPACGSGELLKEALRILEIRRFQGRIVLKGWDQSQAAVNIAKFSLAWEALAWEGRLSVEITCTNSVTTENWPEDVHIILMNPPFKSWQQMDAKEQEAVQHQLSGVQMNKPNLASVFIKRASVSLAPGGVLASVAPRSFFDASSSKKLRESLLGEISPAVLINLANPSLYMHATVQSGIIVAKRGNERRRPTTMVWTDPRPSSVGEALRGLRRAQLDGNFPLSEPGYSVYQDTEVKEDARSWLPRPFSGWALGRFLKQRGGLVSAKSIFNIHQGVRMGSDVFLISLDVFNTLSKLEKKYFRPAVINSTLLQSRLVEDTYIFYPYTEGLEPIKNIEDLQRLVPTYYEKYLRSNQEELESRRSLAKANQPWWGLIWPREWQYKKQPKLVTKYFGNAKAFAWDKSGEFVVVVGHGWVPREGSKHWNYVNSEQYALALVAILASSFGENLLSQVSVQVGGGQWDLSSKYLGELPLLAPTKANTRLILDLAAWGNKISEGEEVDSTELDEFVFGAYGVVYETLRS